MTKSTYEMVSRWNSRCGKKPEKIGTDAYWDALGSQLERIQEELDETREAIVDRNLLELLDGGCDLDVTVAGLNYLSGMKYESAIKRVLDNNEVKYTSDMNVAQSAADLYTSRGMDCAVNLIIEECGVFYSVHRCKDDKIMKLIGHPKVELSDLAVTREVI